jgi:hypothetical protein
MRVLLICPHLLLLPDEVGYVPLEHLALEYLATATRDRHEALIYDAAIGEMNPNMKYQTFVDKYGTKFVHYGVSLKTLRALPEEVTRLRTIGYKIIKERNFEKYEQELLSV